GGGEFTAHRPDVADGTVQHEGPQRVLEASVVTQDDHRAAAVEDDEVDHVVGPSDEKLVGTGEPAGGDERCPRIGHRHVTTYERGVVGEEIGRAACRERERTWQVAAVA